MSDAIAARVPVALGARSYEIAIGRGLLQHAGALIAPILRRSRVAVLTDRNLERRHLPALRAGLAAHGIEAASLALPPGEATKGWRGLEQAVEWLVAQEIARDDVVVALGGGVIGDLAGFAAAILRRGVRFVQIPTTLLAQVDSAVGGKTGINSPRGKNLVGAFHQPSLVIADTGVLATLPPRELRAGYAEVVKYGLLGDAAFFGWLEARGSDLLAGDADAQLHAVRRACEMKAEIVAADETEQGDRALLNLGHTFGHALEAATGYGDRLLHGEAVAIGCVLAFRLSAALGVAPGEAADRVSRHFRAGGLPTRLGEVPGPIPDADGLMALMAQDKKVRDGRIAYVLARGIGEAFLERGVDPAAVRAVLARESGEGGA